MRRPLLAATLLFAVLVSTAYAQLFPSTPAGQPTGTVLIDATFRAIPPADDAPCMAIGAGNLTVRAVNRDEGQIRPVTFYLNGYRGMDPGARIELQITPQESAVTVPLAGALYCWSIGVDAPVRADDSMSVRTNYAQAVALTMVWTTP